MPQAAAQVLQQLGASGETKLRVFAKNQKHLTTLFEVCVALVAPTKKTKSEATPFNIVLSSFIGTITDQCELYF